MPYRVVVQRLAWMVKGDGLSEVERVRMVLTDFKE